MSTNPQKNAIGVVIKALCKTQAGAIFNPASASPRQIILERPDKSTVTKTAALTTDGSDGYVQYITTSADDLDVAGLWHVQVYLEFAGGFKGLCKRARMRVEKNNGE